MSSDIDKTQYLNALDEYFKLKRKYETKWNNSKKVALMKAPNKKMGIGLVKNLEKKCIQCGKAGGTLFSNENYIYSAKCNAVDKKCSLNIQIKMGMYMDNEDWKNITTNNIEDIKNNIIINKLNLLFDLENEDVVIAEFENLKEELKKEITNLKFYKKQIQQLNIFNEIKKEDEKEDDEEGEKDGDSPENKIIFKKDKIDQLDIKLYENINLLKENLKNYRNSGNVKKVNLKTAIDIYISNILPYLEQKRNLEYENIYISKSAKSDLSESSLEFKLIKNKYNQNNKEFLLDAFNVIKRNLKKKMHSKGSRVRSTKRSKKSTLNIPKNLSEGVDASFKPISLQASIDETVESKQIKIDLDAIDEGKNESIDSEDMGEYLDNELQELRENNDVYDDKTVFNFYSRSADDNPGKGKAGGGEKISPEAVGNYEELNKIKNWRRVLSNFHTNKDEFGTTYPLFTSREGDEELNWASVEHWYHAHKFKKNNPDYFKLFTMDSKSEIATDPRKALGAGGRTGNIKDSTTKKTKKFRDDSIQMDNDFFTGGYNEKVMEDGQRLKYNQDDHSKKVLLATKDAKLVHLETRRGQKTKNVPFINTMKIRKELTK